MWNRAKTVLITIILIIASLTVYFSMYLKTYALTPTPSEAEKTGLFPAQYFMPIPGQEVSIDQANASVPFKVRLPTNIGSFVQLKLNTGTGCIYIIYAAVKLSSDASLSDVLDQNGIILIEATNEMTLQQASNIIRAAIDANKNDPTGGSKEVNINGYFGSAGGNVEHVVYWYTETTEYYLLANVNYPLQQLIEIARTIPVN